MPPKSLSGQYAYARGDVVVGYNPKRGEARSGGWVWFTKDERDRYKKASDAQKTAIIKTATARARRNPDANVPFGRIDTTGGRGDPHAASRKSAISSAKKNLGKDDGDDLPSGFYEQDFEDIDGDGDTEEIKRTGKTKSLDLYHGSSQKPGGAIGEFALVPGNYEGEERKAINRSPTLFLTPDRNLATYHAQRGEVEEPESGLTDSQLYQATIVPSEIVDLGDCTDNEASKRMVEAGADVIDCPDYEEGPETIVLDPDVTYIKSAKSLNSGKALPIPPPGKAGKESSDAIKDAMKEYDQAKKGSKQEKGRDKKASAGPASKGDGRKKQGKRKGRGQRAPF